MAKDPEDAGRLIAAAIGQVELKSPPPKAPEGDDRPEPEAKAEPRPAATKDSK